jgi:hypothetical protein
MLGAFRCGPRRSGRPTRLPSAAMPNWDSVSA